MEIMNSTQGTAFPLIILAGGRSRRMQHPKGLLHYEGEPWVLRQIRDFLRCGGEEVILVLGHQHEKYLEAIPSLKEAAAHPYLIKVCINPTPDLGPFSSILCGLQALAEMGKQKPVFLLPIDTPCPQKTVWMDLIDKMENEVRACVPVFNKKGGHPALLSWQFQQELLQVPLQQEDARLDYQIRKLTTHQICRIEIDDARVATNMNYPQDWEQFLRHEPGL